MGNYTRFLADKEYNISPDDENYREELLEVAESFRTFDVALDEFIAQKGYEGVYVAAAGGRSGAHPGRRCFWGSRILTC